MAAIRIYPDENVPVGVVEGLRRRGVDAWSTADAGNLGLGDEAQLCYAAQERAILFTHDVDLVSIARRWTSEGREHSGVVYAHQKAFMIGDCVRPLKDYADMLGPEDMRNCVEFL